MCALDDLEGCFTTGQFQDFVTWTKGTYFQRGTNENYAKKNWGNKSKTLFHSTLKGTIYLNLHKQTGHILI